MTKQQLEEKIVALTQLSLRGKLSMQQAFSQQSSLLADYFADTSCNPPLHTVEVAGVAVKRKGDDIKVIAERGDGQYFEILSMPSDTVHSQEVTARGIEMSFDSEPFNWND